MKLFYKLFVAFAVLLSLRSNAQKLPISDTVKSKPGELDTIIVYANRFPELMKRVAQSVKVISDYSSIKFQPNTADILINSGSVFVQKSQQGGGSPVIRGFEASRVLLMVDGVRLNNAIYRSGHLQNIVTIDNNVLDRLEILYGPSSTIYGSDALGGVVSMYTVNPKLSVSNKININGTAVVRFATATEEAKSHFSFNIAGKKWASLSSISFSSFGSVTQGKNRNANYPNFGKQNFYVQRIGNTDSVFVNSNFNKQFPASYNQVDFLQKILFAPTENIQHVLNIQLSNSTNIPRYDRLSEFKNNAPNFAEWYYGPQIRNMVSYQFIANKLTGFFREVDIVTNFQDIEESRISRRFKSNNKDFRTETVNVVGISANAKHYSGKNEIQLGIESYTNYVNSVAQRININTGVASKINTRYPDGFNKMSYNAIYGQHTLKISDRLTLNEGLRINAVKLNSRFVDTSIMKFPFVSAQQKNLALSGNVGLVYSSVNNTRVAFLLSSGFRSPNIDDLSKVFDSQTGSVIVPNFNIKPEYTYNAEVNLVKSSSQFSYGAALFYTQFKNAIVVDKFQFNGQDSIMYNGVKSAVLANQNKASAYIYGFSIHASYKYQVKTVFDVNYTYSVGKYKHNANTVPLDHIPPVYGKASIKHNEKKWSTELVGLWNGWKRLNQYSPSGEDNLQYATVDGMPSWFILSYNVNFQFIKNSIIQLGVENILDKNYRYFASGISAAGRNFSISIKQSF